MSRWSSSKKTTVEECRALRLPWLKNNGYLNPGCRLGTIQWRNGAEEITGSIGIESRIGSQNFQVGNSLRLFYTRTDNTTGAKTEMDYRISLTATPCRYGGERYWFICPLVKGGHPCQRRATKLYLPSGASYFGCRICYDLTYESSQGHDSRASALVRNPFLLQKALNSKKPKDLFLAFKALKNFNLL